MAGGERLLGTGAARRAAEELKRRKERLDEAEERAMRKHGGKMDYREGGKMGYAGGGYKRGGKTAAAFREVHADEPGIVGRTRSRFGEKRAAAQKTAIALSKARAAGAKIPKPSMKGGKMHYAEGGMAKPGYQRGAMVRRDPPTAPLLRAGPGRDVVSPERMAMERVARRDLPLPVQRPVAPVRPAMMGRPPMGGTVGVRRFAEGGGVKNPASGGRSGVANPSRPGGSTAGGVAHPSGGNRQPRGD